MVSQRLRALAGQLRSGATPREYSLLIVAALLQALTFNLFLAPSRIAPGGVSGLSLIINSLIGSPLGLTQLTLSIPMIVLGYTYLGRFHFLIRTFVVTLVYTLSIDLMAAWLPAEGITTEPLLNALFGGVVGGLAAGLAFRGRGTFAGTGILSRIIQLRTGIPITQLYMMIDGTVILALGLSFGWENALYSLIMLFVWGLSTDYALEGPSVVRTAFIITDSPRQVSDALIERMGIGVTAWSGQGMFTDQERSILFCTISRPDVGTLQAVVSDIDAAAFVVIGHGHSARGGVLRPVRAKTASAPEPAEP